MNTFRKVRGYIINLQNLEGFLYAKNKHAEKGIMENLPFTIQKKNQSRKIYIKGGKTFLQWKIQILKIVLCKTLEKKRLPMLMDY